MNNLGQQSTNNNHRITSLALEVGFDACGISKADYLQDQEVHLHHWLNNGYHGEMGYMERNTDKRLDPRVLVPNAKSVVTVLLNYYPGNPEVSTNQSRISRYALCRDYHVVVKDKLYQLLGLICKEFGEIEGRVFVDSAPVLEKKWAVRAGLGWIGKNSLLINPKFGSYIFIGELIIDLELDSFVSQVPNKCGTCTRCMDSCPTGAIVSPSVIDAQKCISYLTIEKKSPLTVEEQQSLNGWCFGCDICQEVCPWNGRATTSKCEELMPKQEILNLIPSELKSLSNEQFDTIFSDTPLSRAGYERIVSNTSFHT